MGGKGGRERGREGGEGGREEREGRREVRVGGRVRGREGRILIFLFYLFLHLCMQPRAMTTMNK